MSATTDQKFPTLAAALAGSFPWDIDIAWGGKGGVHVLDDDRRVTIDAYGGDGIPTSGKYPAILVKLVSKTSGEITRKAFSFGDYVVAERINPATTVTPNLHLWAIDGAVKWYVLRPENPVDFVVAVEAWIGAWR